MSTEVVNEDASQASSSSEKEQDAFQFSEKGKKMAEQIAEWLLMRHFFPDVKDKRKLIWDISKLKPYEVF